MSATFFYTPKLLAFQGADAIALWLDETVFRLHWPGGQTNFGHRFLRKLNGQAGQILSAVLLKICSCNAWLKGSLQNSSRFFFTSGTPGPGQSVPNKVL